MISIAAAVAVLFGAQGGFAQAAPGSLRLGADFAPLTYRSATTSLNGVEATSSATGIGIGPSAFGFNLGALVGERVALGARLLFQHQSQGETSVVLDGVEVDAEAGDESETTVSLTGYLEYVFGEGSLQGFAGPMVGLQAGSATAGGASASSSGITIGGALGMRGFINEHVSLDPAVVLTYESGSVQPGEGADEVDLSALTVGILVSLSGWVGGDPPVAVEDRGGWSEPASPAIQPRPMARRAPTRPRMSQGFVQATARLGRMRLVYLGRPRTDAGQVALRLKPPLTEQPSDAGDCDALTVTVDGTATELSPLQRRTDAVMRGGAEAYQETIQAMAPVQLFVNMRAAKEVSLSLCDEVLPFGPSARAELITFMRRHRALAPPGTVPDEPAPLPAREAAPAPSGGAGSPPGAAAPEEQGEPPPLDAGEPPAAGTSLPSEP